MSRSSFSGRDESRNLSGTVSVGIILTERQFFAAIGRHARGRLLGGSNVSKTRNTRAYNMYLPTQNVLCTIVYIHILCPKNRLTDFTCHSRFCQSSFPTFVPSFLPSLKGTHKRESDKKLQHLLTRPSVCLCKTV